MISIVLPTYNEAENIKRLIPEIFAVFQKSGLEGRVIVVDDSSPDGTGDTAEALGKKFNIVLIRRQGKLGLGTAYIAGFKKALELGSDYIFSMDADLSHQPKEIPNFVEKISGEKLDLVVGSRYIPGGGSTMKGWRIIVSKGANIIAKTLLGLKASDVTTGYRCYRAGTLEKIELDSIKTSGYSFLEEIIFVFMQNNFRIGEVPIYFDNRLNGKSKLNRMEIPKFFLNMLRLKIKYLHGKKKGAAQ